MLTPGVCVRCSAAVHHRSDFCLRCRSLNQREFVRTWDEVVEELAKREGHRVTRQAVASIAERAIKKVRRLLAADPLVREWLRENGYTVKAEEDDATIVAASPRITKAKGHRYG